MALGLLLILSALAGSESVLYWSSWNRSETSPANAVIGGYSRDYYTFYVIRADLGPNLLPGKFDSTLKVAYVTNDSKEIEVKTFDVSQIELNFSNRQSLKALSIIVLDFTRLQLQMGAAKRRFLPAQCSSRRALG